MAKDLQVRKDNSFITPSFFRGMPDFSDLFGEWPSLSRQSMMNMKETESGYCLSADMPGIPQENIDINISGNMLTIRAENKSEEGDEKSEQGFTRQYRQFQQSLTLPTSVEAEKIEASYENGVLEIFIPKSAATQSKKIQIQAGKGGVTKRIFGKNPAESRH